MTVMSRHQEQLMETLLEIAGGDVGDGNHSAAALYGEDGGRFTKE